jgi:hypothetical protein
MLRDWCHGHTHFSKAPAQDPLPQPRLRATAEGRPASTIIIPRAFPGWDPAAAGGEMGRAAARVSGNIVMCCSAFIYMGSKLHPPRSGQDYIHKSSLSSHVYITILSPLGHNMTS